MTWHIVTQARMAVAGFPVKMALLHNFRCTLSMYHATSPEGERYIVTLMLQDGAQQHPSWDAVQEIDDYITSTKLYHDIEERLEAYLAESLL